MSKVGLRDVPTILVAENLIDFNGESGIVWTSNGFKSLGFPSLGFV